MVQADLFGRIIKISSIDATKTCNVESVEYDAAKVVAFLASADAEYIDGEVITVDGGYSMV